MDWFIFLCISTALFGSVIVVSLILADRDARRTVLVLVLLGLIASALKIWIFQNTPQWHEPVPDSITYDLNAKALAAHWNGESVEGLQHNLRGLLVLNEAGLHSSEWSPNDQLSYASITGSHEWLYAAYIAVWYFFCNATQEAVVATNALWAAFLPAAAFGIALNLGANRHTAVFAGGLALIDPSTGVNASWLLKDTIAAFLLMATLWSLTSYILHKGVNRLLIASIALSAIGGIRFGAFIGITIATSIICACLLSKNYRQQPIMIAGVLLFSWIVQGINSQAPGFTNILQSNSIIAKPHENNKHTRNAIKLIAEAPLKTFQGGTDVLMAKQGESAADESVTSWKNHFFKHPIHATFRSLARTFFAPYPWVAINPGLNWKSSSELYYPGVLLWIICLPGIVTFTLAGLRKSDPIFWLLFLFLASQFAAYTIWLGEWSTRQRVFALSAFFPIAVLGWLQLQDLAKSQWRSYRNKKR